MQTTRKVSEKTTTFADLLRNYETATRNRNAETESNYTTALQELATACTFSVLKKLANVGGALTEESKVTSDSTRTVQMLRRTLAKDLHDIDRRQYATNNATELQFNADGELTTVVVDKSLRDASADLCATSLSGDGMDLVNTAIIAIMTETAKVDITTDFMETPYNVRRLKKKVYIQDISSLGGYETVQTTPIQEVYKAIRREIESNRTMQVASHKYTYLEDICKDTESETETEVYKRLPKYSGLAYETFDNNGKVVGITADMESVSTVENIIAKLNLTTKQAKIIQLRLSGYGQRAIATYMGVTPQAVQCTLKQIQTKATAMGYTPIK